MIPIPRPVLETSPSVRWTSHFNLFCFDEKIVQESLLAQCIVDNDIKFVASEVELFLVFCGAFVIKGGGRSTILRP